MSKGQNEFQPINPLWVVIVAVAIAIIVSQVANAQESFQSNDMNTVGGDIRGSDALGIGFSSPSFGAAISQCVYTKAQNWFWGVWGNQDIGPNYHCMGLAYLQNGMLTAGTLYLCGHTELGELGDDCPAAVAEFSRQVLPEQPVDASEGGIENSAFMDQHAEAEELLAAEVEEYGMLMLDMRASIDNLENSRQQEVMRKAAVKQEIAEYFNVQNPD